LLWPWLLWDFFIVKYMIHLTTVKVSKNKWVITPSDCVDKYKNPLADEYLDGFVGEVRKSLADDLMEKALDDIRYAALEEEFNLKRII